jgi:hypothetical protein
VGLSVVISETWYKLWKAGSERKRRAVAHSYSALFSRAFKFKKGTNKGCALFRTIL